MTGREDRPFEPKFGAAEIGALAHLYRGEMYRSKIWRTRLDATTNWAVVTTGIAMSVTFATPDASPLPIVLVSLLVCVFLLFEARRYRFFDIWRVRIRVLETRFYGPMLEGRGVIVDDRWNDILADDYTEVRFHISLWEAVGRRLRRNYSWIFLIQLVTYLGKLAIHPQPLTTWDDLWQRAAIGPLPGELALAMGAAFHLSWMAVALITVRGQRAIGRAYRPRHDPLPALAERARMGVEE
ncbi:MAG: DUF2270 domain-containing protein [Rhodospirillales bacterium]|nr:MAG: DUF2270 domain-containing protein [Rhodospirillales bacterium]